MNKIKFFLKRQGLYELYLNNTYECRHRRNKNFTIEKAKMMVDNAKCFNKCFDPSKTKEGSRFWYDNVCSLYRDYIAKRLRYYKILE